MLGTQGDLVDLNWWCAAPSGRMSFRRCKEILSGWWSVVLLLRVIMMSSIEVWAVTFVIIAKEQEHELDQKQE